MGDCYTYFKIAGNPALDAVPWLALIVMKVILCVSIQVAENLATAFLRYN